MHRMKKNPVLLALGKNVSEFRNKKELTQEQLSERSGLDPSYISGIERGVRNPSVLSLVRLASGLGTTTSEIFRGVAVVAAKKAEAK